MSKTYIAKRIDRAAIDLKPGQVVFEFVGHDFGIAREDSQAMGFDYVTCAFEPDNPNAPFFSIPFEDLQLIIHHEMVAKLMKDPVAIIASTSELRANLQHAAIGIGDEYFEYLLAGTKENKLEELGDLLFYTESLLLHSPVSKKMAMGLTFMSASYSETLCLLFQTVKRCVFYVQDLNIPNLVRVYNNLLVMIRLEAEYNGFTFEDVQKANIKKLAKRYADFEYSDTRAKERIDKVGTDEEEKPNSVCDGNL